MQWLKHIHKHILLAGLTSALAMSPALVSAQQIASTPPPPLGEAPKGPRFGGAILVEAAGGAYRDSLGLNRVIEEIKRSPFTDVIVQVRAQGDAFYASSIVPRAYGMSEAGEGAASFDPLRTFVDEIKRDPANPRRVYAWIEALRVTNVSRALPDPEGHITKTHPEWLSKNANLDSQDAAGNVYLEPGLSAVQDYLASVAREIAGNYQVDGIVVDGLRYPGFEGEWGYHPDMIAQWRNATGSADRPEPGDPVWSQMRRDALTETLRRIQTAVRETGQKQVIAVGLAEGPAPRTLEEFPFTVVYQGAMQDWPAWMQSKLVDAVILQNYHPEGGEETDAFDAWNVFAQQMVKSTGVEIIPAVAGFENLSTDALAQMKRVRGMGFAGVALSNMRDLILDTASREIFYRALASSALSMKSVRVPFEEAMTPEEISEQALVVASAPAPEPAAAEPMETAPEAPGSETAQAAPPELPEAPNGDQAREMVGGARFENLLEPAPGSVEYLKRKFKNIF